MARTSLRYLHCRARRWVCYLLVLLFFALLLGSGMDPDHSLVSRAVWATVYALLPTALFGVWTAAVGYFRMVRGARLNLHSGAVLESGFGDQAMVFRDPLTSIRISYAAIKSVHAYRDFVFMRRHGSATISVYPRRLFPVDAIYRIRRATGR